MAEFTLPANSKVSTGKSWPAPAGAKRTKTFKIYRWSPDDGANPRYDRYTIDLDDCGPMVLDALIKIKGEIDPTLTFRRSCREGICGSCSMNIDGANTLACTMAIADVKGDVAITPLPHMAVVKDLVPDMTHFYAQYASIKPWLQTVTPEPQREWRQSPQEREKLEHERDTLQMVLAALESGNPLRESHLTEEQQKVTRAFRLLSEKPRMVVVNTADDGATVCPKGLNPAKAIAEIKKMMVTRAV